VDAIAFQMQAAVSICIIGPVANRNSEVEVRRYVVYTCNVLAYWLIRWHGSVHVNWPGGVTNVTWPLHDPIGYAEAESSMCGYGRANFSKLLTFCSCLWDTDLNFTQLEQNAGVALCLRKSEVVARSIDPKTQLSLNMLHLNLRLRTATLNVS